MTLLQAFALYRSAVSAGQPAPTASLCKDSTIFSRAQLRQHTALALHNLGSTACLRKVDHMLSAARPNFQHKSSRGEHAAQHGGDRVPIAQHRRRVEAQVTTA